MNKRLRRTLDSGLALALGLSVPTLHFAGTPDPPSETLGTATPSGGGADLVEDANCAKATMMMAGRKTLMGGKHPVGK
ncbi:MAG: hypothetical protein L6R36_008686, partial [Xanthoria steineri]